MVTPPLHHFHLATNLHSILSAWRHFQFALHAPTRHGKDEMPWYTSYTPGLGCAVEGYGARSVIDHQGWGALPPQRPTRLVAIDATTSTSGDHGRAGNFPLLTPPESGFSRAQRTYLRSMDTSQMTESSRKIADEKEIFEYLMLPQFVATSR